MKIRVRFAVEYEFEKEVDDDYEDDVHSLVDVISEMDVIPESKEVEYREGSFFVTRIVDLKENELLYIDEKPEEE